MPGNLVFVLLAGEGEGVAVGGGGGGIFAGKCHLLSNSNFLITCLGIVLKLKIIMFLVLEKQVI